MKLLKVLGVTCAISSVAVLGAWVNNQARIEKANIEFWEQQMKKSVRDSVKITGQNEKFLKDSSKTFTDSIKQNLKRTAKIIR